MKRSLLITVSAFVLMSGSALAADPAAGTSTSIVDQLTLGSGNQAAVDQLTTATNGNDSYIFQRGSNNSVGASNIPKSGVYQHGDSQLNRSQIWQGFYWSGSSLNSADVEQTGINTGTNLSQIVQDGTDNTSHVLQGNTWNGNESLIVQSGSNNTATVHQAVGDTDNTHDSSNVTQTG